MPETLKDKKCEPCSGDVPALEGAELREYLSSLSDGWEIVDNHHLRRIFEFNDFKGAWRFVNQIARLAEEEQHHPDLGLTWGKATVKIWTHAIDGLSENDFILAAKIDELETDAG